MDDLLRQVNREYSVAATSIKPYGSVWRLHSANGSYTLKRIKNDPQIWIQLARIITEYNKLGFTALVPILASKTGEPFMKADRFHYVLSPWIDGIKPIFSDSLHLKMIAGCFGKLHWLSKSMFLLQNTPCNDYLAEHKINLEFLVSLMSDLRIAKTTNRIDRAIVRWGDYFIHQARICIAGLSKSGDEWSLINQEKGFCHNDPAPGNMIIRNNNCYLIDFEHSKCDLFIKELSILILRSLQANQWDPKIADLIVESYTRERPLISEELRILPYLLFFPRRFWRLCYQRYREHLNWTERRFQKRLWEIIGEEKRRAIFLKTWSPEMNEIS